MKINLIPNNDTFNLNVAIHYLSMSIQRLSLIEGNNNVDRLINNFVMERSMLIDIQLKLVKKEMN